MRNLILGVLLLPLVAFAASAEKIELENGDTIDVEIVSESEDSVVVTHPQLGEMTVPRSAIKPPKPPHPGLFGTSFMEGWTRNFGAGFSGSSGNSQDASFNVSLSFNHDTDSYRSMFDSAYFFSSQDNVRGSNELFANYKHDFLLGDSGFFLFAQGRYQYDQFQSWLHRVSASGGVGYDFIAKKKIDLRGNIGFGFARTFGTEQEWKPEGVVGVVFAWRPLEGHEFAADATYFPNLDMTPEFRFLANATYTISVSGVDGLKVRFGAKEEYDSEAVGLNNNLKYYGNIVYDF